MDIRFNENRKMLEIKDARIIFKNFSGEASLYNKEGDRGFAVVIPDPEIAENLKSDGWNVKEYGTNPEETPLMYLPVKIKYKNGRGPDIIVDPGNGRLVKLDEESVTSVDRMMINAVDMDIRPYDYEFRNITGRAAYLDSMKIYQRMSTYGAEFEAYNKKPLNNEDDELPF